MVSLNQDKKGKKTSKTVGPVASQPNIPAKKLAYKTLRANGIPRDLCKSVVGYSPKTGIVDQSGTIDQQREKALKALDLTLYSQFKTLKDIRDDEQKSCQSDRINAVKTINSMVPGYTAPSEVKVNTSAIMMEFKDLSSQDLANLADVLGVKASVPYQCTEEIDGAQVIDSIESNDSEQRNVDPLVSDE